jgi:hypothetical protein
MDQADAGGESFAATIGKNLGRPDYDQRLSDKILAAFNHAYAMGEQGVAEGLLVILEAVEDRNTQMGKKKTERDTDALGQAKMWIAFVQARDRYRALCDGEKSDPALSAESLEEMKEAYKRWSFS